MDKRVFLKVKIKSLAEEARIIRKEERKRHGTDNRLEREALYTHRVNVVRSEQRHSLLAYGFLRGRRVDQIEGKTLTRVDWKKVRSMVERFGPVQVTGFDKWLGEAH